ncbi:MAG: hypothetical protein COA99_14375 [Moraxellaceae bacterium]|nr:MAG: hypothetical protein COA99_14375 [Moraxellaceae bacterium]
MDHNDENKRLVKRKTKREDVLIELTMQNSDGSYTDKIIRCETVDLSKTGLKLYVSESIPEGTVMDLCVRFSSGQEFFLTTELRWLRPLVDDGWFFAGFEIYEGENTDYQKWADCVDTL